MTNVPRSIWDRDGPLDNPPDRMWLVPANLGEGRPNWDTTLGSSRQDGFNGETEYLRADLAAALTQERDEARALLREAREALLPLARECETYSDNAPEDTDTTVCDWDTAPLTLGDLRRARAVLAKLEALK